MKRITLEDVKELAGCVVFGLLVWLSLWIYLIVTPDQYSAECEAMRYEMEQAEGGVKLAESALTEYEPRLLERRIAPDARMLGSATS